METYAVKRLMRIFKEYHTAISPQDNEILSKAIVNALITKTEYQDKFKIAFWKILWNLKLKGKARAHKTLDDLFNLKWKSAEEFINATDDELDYDSAQFRNNVRMREFERMQNTKKINEQLDKEIDGAGVAVESTKLGLICARCHSNNTEYSCLKLRRGDEGMTAFVICLDCKKRWKFSG